MEFSFSFFLSSSSIEEDPELAKFDSVLLKQHVRSIMDGNLGRIRTTVMLMAVGNKKGTAGFTVYECPQGRGGKAIQSAINRAAQRLITVPLYEGRTGWYC